jgi:tripartite-type tricarboxylate transporter receptor subunit TctC
MLTRRKTMQLTIGAVAMPFVSTIASAQAFPNRPVTLIVPWGAGGGTDTTLRALATATEKHLGQPIIIENRPGASGTLGPAQMAANAKSDGYTLSQLSTAAFRLPHMTKTSYDPTRDFTFVIGVCKYIYGVVVRSDAPWKTFAEVLAYGKANPGKFTFGNSGAGTGPQVTMDLIGRQQGIRWTGVPFRGLTESTTALLGGHIDAVADASGWAQLVDEGKFRLLVSFGESRTKKWPHVPTLRESGIDLVLSGPYGLVGPKGLEGNVVKTLHDAFKRGMEEASFAAMLGKLDQELNYMSPAEYHAFALKEFAEQKRIVKELGLKVN